MKFNTICADSNYNHLYLTFCIFIFYNSLGNRSNSDDFEKQQAEEAAEDCR